MKLTHKPEPWTTEIKCPSCKCEYEIDEGDVQTDGYKIQRNTYWFAGASSTPGFFVTCDNCHEEIILCIPGAKEEDRRVQAGFVPTHIQKVVMAVTEKAARERKRLGIPPRRPGS